MAQTRKRLFAGVGLAALAAGLIAGTASPVGVPSAGALTPITIRLLGVNDFHGRIQGLNSTPATTDDELTVRYAATVQAQRTSAPGGEDSVAFLGAGDLVGASLFESAIATPPDQPTIDVMNALGLQASAVGNHEFDQGYDDLVDRIIGGSEGDAAEWTYLAANVYDGPTDTDADVADGLEPYALIELNQTDDADPANDVTLGVIGVVTEETPSLVSPAGVAGLRFGDPVEALNRVAAELSDGSGDEADVIVAVLHEGGPSEDTIEEAIAASPVFASIVNDTSALVQAMFTGHTHQAYVYTAPAPGGGTRPIVQTGQYGENVGVIDLTVDADAGHVTISFTAQNVARTTADPATLIADPVVAEVKTIVDAAVTAANVIGQTPVGDVTADITTAFAGGSYVNGVYTGGTRDDRAAESALGDLVADALLDTLDDPARGGAEIGVVNPGGLRAELLYGADGVITYAEANAVLPFVNNLHTITLTGEQFKTLLEQQWQRTSTGAVASRPYLQLGLSSNVTYTFDPDLPEGSRVTSIVVNGAPIDMDADYRIGTFSFLTEGGDNFHVFTEGTDVSDSGLVDRDAWIAYITANSPLTPDFARQAVDISDFPTSARTGETIEVPAAPFNLTSLGAPETTTISATLGGVDLGDETVTDGVAEFEVPDTVESGLQELELTAAPSGTTTTVEVYVDPALGAVTPNRLFDTRPGQSPNALRDVPKTKIGGATVLTVQATDLPDLVPADGVGAVSLNVAVTNPEADGFVTVYDCGVRRLVASVNYVAGETVSNAVVVPVSSTGTICFYSLAQTDVVVDINGWIAEGSDYTAVSPDRLFDTRAGESPDALLDVTKAKVGGAGQLLIDVTGVSRGSTVITPATGVAAVSLNVAVTNPVGAGFLTVYDCGSRELVASVNYVAGETASNAVIAPVSPGGNICFYSYVPTDIVVDINGWYASGGSFSAAGPNRLFDTRNESPDAVFELPDAQVGPANIVELPVVGIDGITPLTNVAAVSINVAATQSAAPGFVTVYDCAEEPPFTANLNYLAGQTIANAVIAPVSESGTICFFASSDVDLVVDINGWFAG